MSLKDEIVPILKTIAVLSPATFLFRGEPVQVAPGPVQALAGFPNHPLPSMPLIREMQNVLYAHCYMRRFEEEQPRTSPVNLYSPDPAFLQRLSDANSSEQRWEAGWTIYSIAQNGQVWLQKGDRQRSAVPGEFITSGVPGMPPRTGSIVSVLAPRESMNSQPGYYFAFGGTLSDIWDEFALLRFYFNAPSECAPDLLHYLITSLNRYQVPFRMKAPSDPSLYQRVDTIVLYTAKRYYDVSVQIVRDMPRATRAGLRASTPLFSRALEPGVGMAEDPGNGESFGMHRCRMMAEGIVDAWMAGDQSVEARWNAIGARFSAGGFELHLPYLGAGSIDFHEVPAEVAFAYA